MRSWPILGVVAAAAVVLVGGCSSSGGNSKSAGSQPVLPSINSSQQAGSAPQGGAQASASTSPDTPSSSPTSSSGGCANATVTDLVRAALVATDGRPAATEQPGMTYYGTCGSTAYAVASFEAAPTATAAQTVAFQDHGVWPEFFTRNGDASWHLVGSADGPPGPRDCTDFTQAPSTLREIWHNCIQATPQSAPTVSPAASCGPADAQFVQVLSVTLGSDGSATSTAHPLTLVCGGPDDRHFDIGSATETIHILANADIMVLAGNSGSEMAITLKQLAATTPIAPAFFRVSGSSTAVTGLTQQFVP